MENQQEEWRTIASAPDYEVSDKGRVRRVKPDWQGKYAGRVLKPSTHRGGYLAYVLCHEGAKMTKKAHRLVCEAFNGPCPPDKEHCAHWDGDVLNNSPGNLYWATAKENSADRERHGTVARGERSGAALHPEKWARGDDHWTRRCPERVVRGDAHPRRLRPEIVPKGEQMPAAKLTEEQAKAIIAAPKYFGLGRDLAARYGVSMALISAIRKGRAWSYLHQDK